MGATAPSVVVSAPGKCILFGEHAVVYGQPAVAVALEQRLEVSMRPAGSWSIDGSALTAERHPHITMLRDTVLGAEAPPMALHVRGDIPSGSGLGSSAALSVAAAAGFLQTASSGPLDTAAIAHLAHLAEAGAQAGRASPMDTSTSAEGGVVVLSDQVEDDAQWLYTRTLPTPEGDRSWEIHALRPPEQAVHLVLGNTGIHAATSAQVAMVANTLAEHPERMRDIEAIGAVARRGLRALMRGDYEAVGHAMTENHVLLRHLGVSSPELEALVRAAAPSSLGVKMTGAGGGGCMVALTLDPVATSQAIELAGGRVLVSSLLNHGVHIHDE